MTQVSPATQSDAQAFCDLCQWVYECWITHSNLFEYLPERLQEDRNVPLGDFLKTAYGQCLNRLNEISQEYIILQIANLHDPALQGRSENLSVDFFVNQEFWSEEEMSTIRDFALELDGLYKNIEDVRNKILAHNDRFVFRKRLPLGGFLEGDDEKYFRTLGQLCSMIWNKFSNRNWPYGTPTFDFIESGIFGDLSCPSNEARELRKLIVEALPRIANDVDPASVAKYCI